jgi:hypothetical protein
MLSDHKIQSVEYQKGILDPNWVVMMMVMMMTIMMNVCRDELDKPLKQFLFFLST